YYFKHFLYGLSDAPPSDEQIRSSVGKRIEAQGGDWAFDYLKEVDPISAKRIHPSDLYRISRALEVWETSARPLSSYSLPNEPRYGMHPLIIGLHRDQDILHKRIIMRVEQMFEEGLEEEIRGLLDMGAKSWWPGMQGIGYREFFLALESGEFPRSVIAEQIIRNSRLYAKRQLTFFKSFTNAHWFDTSEKQSILTEIESFVPPFDM
ncbi:MAG: tRNA (adenosine(37)-N6)-dimethylallyltransferase MiaA, partial [Spirochaetia bacterium]|nr:tRNA (adenosine(37)-N6)-dimethylallyltransferase MiaA [Spirochaetia bacterium]